jgi:signal peptidase I
MSPVRKESIGEKVVAFGNDLLNFVLIFLLVIALRTYVVAPFQVNGQSMNDTLSDQEYIIVNKAVYGEFFGYKVGDPQRGDVVVLEPPLDHKIYYIKRVIGLPGETVRFEGNRVVIVNKQHPDGFTLDEDYLRCVEKIDGKTVNNCNYDNVPRREFKVPEGSYFVMGDNRMNSTDSRFCFSSCASPDASPFLTKEHIIGKTYAVIWPLDRSRTVKEVSYP